jgi:hypothetical protein
MVDKITTVPKSKVGSRIGRLDDQDIVRLNRAVLVFLGLAAPALRASALMQTDDSQGPADVRHWAHGSDRLSVGLGRGSCSFGGDRRRS